MKVFLDDERPVPDGWVAARWPDEVIALLEQGGVEVVSLDHDLGDDSRGTGYDVLLWIERAVATRGFVAPALAVHSANVSARQKMEAAIATIRRLSEQAADEPAMRTLALEEIAAFNLAGFELFDAERIGPLRITCDGKPLCLVVPPSARVQWGPPAGDGNPEFWEDLAEARAHQKHTEGAKDVPDPRADEFACPICGGTVRPLTSAGRRWRFHGLYLDVPADLPIRTCDNCKEGYFGPVEMRRLDAALAEEYLRVGRQVRLTPADLRGPHPHDLKLFVDANRPAPDGWVVARTARQAVTILEHHRLIAELSLDSDLGDAATGTPNHVLMWIAQAIVIHGVHAPRIVVHGTDPEAIRQLQASIRLIEMLAEGREAERTRERR